MDETRSKLKSGPTQLAYTYNIQKDKGPRLGKFEFLSLMKFKLKHDVIDCVQLTPPPPN
ncbi:hypothetical protein Acal02_03016 [Acinetobacter calcoaceticus]